jgi:hypothetical protein
MLTSLPAITLVESFPEEIVWVILFHIIFS